MHLKSILSPSKGVDSRPLSFLGNKFYGAIFKADVVFLEAE